VFVYYLIMAFSGLLSGATAVLFGFGGGFLMVPLLFAMNSSRYGSDTLLGKESIHIAVATSTCVMIVNACVATYKHHRKGNLLRSYIYSLASYIGIGSMAGVALTSFAPSDVVRYGFIIYLALTISDCLLRSGFVSPSSTAEYRPLSKPQKIIGGLSTGLIAGFLGVGGSVLTVPLLRRQGLTMSQATALASPLSLPVAIVGSFSYALLDLYHPISIGPGYIGYIEITSFFVLSIGSTLGVIISSKYIGRLHDKTHAWTYLTMLIIVLAVMMV
jgi:uncharacterized protein